MDRKMMWSIVNFLIIVGYITISVSSGITIALLIMHVFTTVSPIDSSVIPILFIGSIGISFFVIHRMFKFFTWYYLRIKSELRWLNNPPMREEVLSIKRVETLEPEDDWMNNKKRRKQ